MWYLIISRRIASINKVKEVTQDHFVWMHAQHKQGTVIISGPTPDRSHGIYVVKAETENEARKIADSDPFQVAGVRSYDLYPWEVHQMLGVGPFSLPGISHLAEYDPSTHYTLLPKD